MFFLTQIEVEPKTVLELEMKNSRLVKPYFSLEKVIGLPF